MKKVQIFGIGVLLVFATVMTGCNAPIEKGVQETEQNDKVLNEGTQSTEVNNGGENVVDVEETAADPNNDDLVGKGLGMDLGLGAMNYDIETLRERMKANGFEDLYIVAQMEQIDEPWNLLWKNAIERMGEALDIKVQINNATSDATIEAQQMDNAVNLGVDGILLFPVNDEQAIPVVEQTQAAGVPVVGAFIIPGAALGDGASNVERGKMAAHKILKQFEEMGVIPNVVVADLPFYYGILTERKEGFVEVMQAAEDEGRANLMEDQFLLEVTNENWMQSTLDTLATNPEINVIFATYGSPLISCAAGVKQSGLDVKVYGIDADAAICQLVKDGDIEAVHPYDAQSNAYCALFTLLRLINGDENITNFTEPDFYQTMWLTKENIDNYAEKALGTVLE